MALAKSLTPGRTIRERSPLAAAALLPKVTYTHDYTASSSLMTNAARLTEVDYPTTRKAYYDYGTSGSFDEALSRVALLKESGHWRFWHR